MKRTSVLKTYFGAKPASQLPTSYGLDEDASPLRCFAAEVARLSDDEKQELAELAAVEIGEEITA